MSKKEWTRSDENLLIQCYKTKTIYELQKIFSDRSADAINSKIKRLKEEGKLEGEREDEAVKRALSQRSRPLKRRRNG